MPLPNEHAARQRDPGDFESGSFRNVSGNFPAGISAIMGRLRGQTTMTIQSFRFDRNRWSVSEAKRWLKDHGFESGGFEEAMEKRSFWGGVV